MSLTLGNAHFGPARKIYHYVCRYIGDGENIRRNKFPGFHMVVKEIEDTLYTSAACGN